MSALSGPPGPTDAELVTRVLAADREAFAAVYDRYGPRLHDFAYSMLRHREDAANAVANSFVLFAERLVLLRDPDRLGPWLYAIVRSECLRRLRARKHIAYDAAEQPVAMADDVTGAAAAAELATQEASLRRLVWEASAGLADRDRALLDLHLRQGLEGADLGEAIGVSPSNAHVMLDRLRARMDRSLGALLVARLGRDDCEDLDTLVAGRAGLSPSVPKRLARHVDHCDPCSERRRKLVSPSALFAGVPVFVAPLGLRDRVVGGTRLVATGASDDGAFEWLDRATPDTVAHRRVGVRLRLAAAALLVLAGLGTVLLWPDTNDTATTTPHVPSGRSASAAGASAPSSTATLTPGALTVSTGSIDLGRTRTDASFGLTNIGGQPALYQVGSRTRWLGVGQIGGEVAAGSSRQITVQADRNGLPEGRSAGIVVVTWDGGRARVTVTLDQEHDPVVGTPTTPSASSCDVPVGVRVTDESAISVVRLAWSGPAGSGSVRLQRARPGGNTWNATVRITVAGGYALTASATDSRGNAANGPTARVDINPCPQ